MKKKLDTTVQRDEVALEVANMYIEMIETEDEGAYVAKFKEAEDANQECDIPPWEPMPLETKRQFRALAQKGIGQIMVARRMILRRNPYFATIMMGMDFQVTPDQYIAKTNGHVIVFNPICVAQSMDQSQTNALVLHELLHNILLHSFRRGKMDKEMWNVAADLVVNHTIDTFFTEEQQNQQNRYGYKSKAARKADCMPITLPPNALLTEGAVNRLNMLRSKNGLIGIDEDTDEKTAEKVNNAYEDLLQDFQSLMGQIQLTSSQKGKTMIGGPSTNRVYHAFRNIYKLIKLSEDEEPEGPEGPGGGPPDGKTGKGKGEIGEEPSHGWGDETGDIDRILSLYAGMGEVDDYSAEKTLNERQAQITATLLQKAAIMAQSNGMRQDDPAKHLSVTFENEFTPEVPWNQQFRNVVMDITRKEDYTWRRPNKKWMQQDIYMPTIQGPKDEKSIVIGIDVSGSISQSQLALMSEELSNSLSDISFKAHIVMCDTQVKKIENLSNEDLPFNIQVQAGGGTHLSPILETVVEKKWNPVMTVMFTDMEFNWESLRQTYYDVGGAQTCGETVFLNFGTPIKAGEDMYGYQTMYKAELNDPFYGTLIDMQRSHAAKPEEQSANLIAEPL